MTGLTPDDLSRVIDGFMWTRLVDKYGAPCNDAQDAEQETRIIAALSDESDTQMLLEVAKHDMAKLRSELDAAKVENVNLRSGLKAAVDAIASFWDSARRLRENI